jgi:hypothetical protein
MRARQVVGRDEPPGLRTGVAEGVHHAARNEDERTRLRRDLGIAIEEGEGALEDEVRFLLLVVDMWRWPAPWRNRADEERQAIALAVRLERHPIPQDPEGLAGFPRQMGDSGLLNLGYGKCSFQSCRS